MDPLGLGTFLRTRREALQPEDVGMPRGPRRRTTGLRYEKVASLVGMSPDYFARLERGAGALSSEQMVAAIARGLRLSLPEHDHLFTLAGHSTPRRNLRTDHVAPTLRRVIDRLTDTPAQVMGGLGEPLVQTPRRRSARRSDPLGRPGLQRGLPPVHRPRRVPSDRGR